MSPAAIGRHPILSRAPEPTSVIVSRPSPHRPPFRLIRAALAVTAVAGFLAIADGEAHADARGDRIDQLGRTITQARDEKARIAAAVNLGRLQDPRVLRPLLLALDDDSHAVRAVAAAALGQLGYAAALPALHRATRDPHELVRERARGAIASIEIKAGAKRRAAQLLTRRPARRASYQIGARERPLMREATPRMHIVVQSVTDRSGAGPQARQRERARDLRGIMDGELGADPSVTTDFEAAASLGLAPYALDVSIVSMNRRATAQHVEISCQIRIAISDSRGRMMSFVTGGATVQVPRRTFRQDFLAFHQREAMESAFRSAQQNVVAFLNRELASR
jgi:hypothetical protein